MAIKRRGLQGFERSNARVQDATRSKKEQLPWGHAEDKVISHENA